MSITHGREYFSLVPYHCTAEHRKKGVMKRIFFHTRWLMSTLSPTEEVDLIFRYDIIPH